MHEGADKPHLFLHLYPPRTQREELCPLRDALDYAQCDSAYMESGCCDSARGASSYRMQEKASVVGEKGAPTLQIVKR